MALVEANGLPISVQVASAQPHEVTLAFDLVQGCWTQDLPERVIGDKAYDSDPLDAELAECGVEMIAPHRRNRKKENKTQDGRPLRRYKRRWKVERFFAWLQNFRRLVTRWDRKVEHFAGMVQLATVIILVRNCF
jgi:transposase